MRWAFTFFIAVASVRITITESGPVLGPEQEKKRDLLSGIDKGYLDEEKLLINRQNQEESIHLRRKNVFDNIELVI